MARKGTKRSKEETLIVKEKKTQNLWEETPSNREGATKEKKEIERCASTT